MMLPAKSSLVAGKCVDNYNFRLSSRSFRWRQHYESSYRFLVRSQGAIGFRFAAFGEIKLFYRANRSLRLENLQRGSGQLENRNL